MLITNPNGFNGELFDVEQIEVLKGPQGALYGRNAAAGAILVTTQRPDNEFTGKIMGGVGDDNLVKGQAMVSGPIIQDQLYGRIAFSYRDTDGQFKNKFTGDDDTGQQPGGNQRPRPHDLGALGGSDPGRHRQLPRRGSGCDQFQRGVRTARSRRFLEFRSWPKMPTTTISATSTTSTGENNQETTFFSLKADYEMRFGTLTLIGAYDDLEEDLFSDGTSGAFGVYSAVPSDAQDNVQRPSTHRSRL